jgi:hypothetical protein
MKTGWKEVARLGMDGALYPHVLVDPHGWCLRLGPDPRRDEKYYSGLPTLLQGIVEQGVRRSLMTAPTVIGVQELRLQVQRGLRTVVALSGSLVLGIIRQTSIRPSGPTEDDPGGPDALRRSLVSLIPIPAHKESL